MLSANLHAFSHGDCTRWLWLGLTFDFDQASAASSDWLEKWMVTEAWNLNANLLGGANDESSLRNLHLHAVDSDVEKFYWSVSHANQPFALTKTVEDIGLNA